jgi:hypothetical protein
MLPRMRHAQLRRGRSTRVSMRWGILAGVLRLWVVDEGEGRGKGGMGVRGGEVEGTYKDYRGLWMLQRMRRAPRRLARSIRVSTS